MTGTAVALHSEAIRTIEVVQKVADLRGGSKAKLVKCSEGKHYVLKELGNAQGPQSLIAEFIAAELFSALELPVARVHFAHIRDESLRSRLGQEESGAENTLHLAIAYAADPAQSAIYDTIPMPLLRKSNGHHCFWGSLVADRWLANQDVRQAVFLRRRAVEPAAVANAEKFESVAGIVPVLIDHGMCFNGRSLDFQTAPAHGLYSSLSVYQGLTCVSQLKFWIDRAKSFEMNRLWELLRILPRNWVSVCGQDRWHAVLEKVPERAQRLPRLLEESLEHIQARQKAIAEQQFD